MNGKGDQPRPCNRQKFDAGYALAFGQMRCRTCRWWKCHGEPIWICERIESTDSKFGIFSDGYFDDVPHLKTDPDFACIQWEPKDE